ncbi:pantetheine-phosphate adenylyltransferase [Cytophaga hutchinsonii]|uniref:Phosphopantetheine adenylyltransferase n=1 Tax=Cytophaga hutchinsonii (strain ATCC 33406 / DSM 1761 / CIP 103989 / NBRC 15051 / NCIMB 9469 / D465) TaxID=269798 RepID=COAD_CYTH3|nr:pantetheine-phosphate adenylyltransferase [Cytophaga hutchinsonii]Q11RP5.1 RecName: Full=Phosphopantetheine adenylyltransferase; AltName: Full=Dephospho-CoA pyrophosphorylase; AltName: Full=Pantetheine-phosphate adenylyltransferase; Short=PPAT [Cytophaga hutchinsonii ATCC 33406]ABG59919.1 Phosphopantetheine adenylyltransferase [Cytophaga hutchinsonii ATCC 33406]SFX27405.1 Phosphopantetheine adenylyltransferase [Cytophaga hutchinsonii ATCC 33406]
MSKIAIFPGSFDPFTKGHEDIVRRSLPLFDKVIIAIGNNAQKNRYFEIDYIIPKIESCFEKTDNVEVKVFKGLTAEFAKESGAQFLIRGLRNTTDFEYENSISQANKYLWKDLETVFMITSPHLAYISSSLIRDIHKYDGDVSGFLPYKI